MAEPHTDGIVAPGSALPTAPLAGASLIIGYAVAVSTGSRPLGGLVLLAGGLCCVRVWHRRHGARLAAQLTGVGLAAFVLSHVLALALGAWPSVLLCSAVVAVVVWLRADSLVPATASSDAARARRPV